MGRAQNNLTKAQKYEKQKKQTNERVRRHREKMSEEALEKKRKYDRDRYKKLKDAKKIKPVAELKPREQRLKRKVWRKSSAKYRLKKKSENCILGNTPPESETEDNDLQVPVEKENSKQKKCGRKKVRKDRASAYRQLKKKDDKIRSLERRINKYQKRLEREKGKRKSLCSPSPKTKVANLIQKEKVSPAVRKRLFIGFALEKQLKTQVTKNIPKSRERVLTKKLIGSDLLRKYRVQRSVKHIINYEANRGLKIGDTSCEIQRKKYVSKVTNESESLRSFYESDTVSRMCPGKKDVKRLGKFKKQRRVLLDSLKHLYKRYVQENESCISYTSFTRARPFWVVPPQARDRDTCACVMHSNMELIISALRYVNVVQEKNTWDILKASVCDIKNELCMLEKCPTCKNKKIEFKSLEDGVNIKVHQWKTVTEARVIKGVERKIKKVVKGKEVHDLSHLKKQFTTMLSKFKKHVFDMFHQAYYKKETKENLKEGEIMFLFDFSENYNAKYEHEIQSMHFGASKKQISLHTGIRYHNHNGKIVAKGFCTVSDCLDHQSHGVWAHLDPILKDTKNLFPLTEAIYVFSDSPSSQYRNRNNIYLFKTLLPTYFPAMKKSQWNYSEPGHGKGPMDGIGGTLKRRADEHVHHQNDITCARDFVDVFKDSKIMVLEVPTKKMESMKMKLKCEIPPIKNIMQTKQVTYYKGNIQIRKLSCLHCSENKVCPHYSLNAAFEVKSKKPPKKKLKVEEVFTDSDTDDQSNQSPLKELENYDPGQSSSNTGKPRKLTPEVKTGDYILVRYITTKTIHQYVGICLTCGEKDEEGNIHEVVFLKSANKEDKKTFMLNDKDVAYISASQIVAGLPPPTIIQKGSRSFYEFKRPVDVY